MNGVNLAIILGNVGRDPELSYTPSGVAVCKLSVATSEQWTDKQSGQKQERTEWHKIVIWQRTAENAAKFLQKGQSVYIEGKIKTRSWDDKQTGEKRYMTEIHAERVVFLGGGSGQQGGRDDSDRGQREEPSRGGGQHRTETWGRQEAPAKDEPAEDFGSASDEEIPF